MFYENTWPDTLQWTTPLEGEIKSEPDTYCFAKDMMSPCQKVPFIISHVMGHFMTTKTYIRMWFG